MFNPVLSSSSSSSFPSLRSSYKSVLFSFCGSPVGRSVGRSLTCLIRVLQNSASFVSLNSIFKRKMKKGMCIFILKGGSIHTHTRTHRENDGIGVVWATERMRPSLRKKRGSRQMKRLDGEGNLISHYYYYFSLYLRTNHCVVDSGWR